MTLDRPRARRRVRALHECATPGNAGLQYILTDVTPSRLQEADASQRQARAGPAAGATAAMDLDVVPGTPSANAATASQRTGACRHDLLQNSRHAAGFSPCAVPARPTLSCVSVTVFMQRLPVPHCHCKTVASEVFVGIMQAIAWRQRAPAGSRRWTRR